MSADDRHDGTALVGPRAARRTPWHWDIEGSKRLDDRSDGLGYAVRQKIGGGGHGDAAAGEREPGRTGGKGPPPTGRTAKGDGGRAGRNGEAGSQKCRQRPGERRRRQPGRIPQLGEEADDFGQVVVGRRGGGAQEEVGRRLVDLWRMHLGSAIVPGGQRVTASLTTAFLSAFTARC